MPHFDTIVAPITGSHAAPVAIVRISGPDSWSVARQLMPTLPAETESHRAYYGQFTHGDDGLCVLFAEGHSYTGEATAELNIHGSLASVRNLLERCHQLGARAAEPGEFTQRAFLNGRLDLTQAEGVRDTIEAETLLQQRAADRSRSGALHQELRDISEKIFQALASVEASTDFEEEIGPLDPKILSSQVEAALHALEAIRGRERASRILREGLRVALIGPPNAGKSSLLNALLGFDRAIVTDIPGTTRDTVEEVLDLQGIPCRFVDTAGLRDSTETVEQLGIERSRQAAELADIVLFLSEDRPTDAPAGALWVQTKVDIVNPDPSAWIQTSAVAGHGLSELKDRLRALAEERCPPTLVPVQARHVPLLDRSIASLHAAISGLEAGVPSDLLSTLLRDAIHSLGEITGETASEDMVERIFRSFCIGK